MSTWYYKPTGRFSLLTSNTYCGSYFSLNDLKIIFNNSDDDYPTIKFNNKHLVDETEISRAWYSGQIKTSLPLIVNGKKRSFDELILSTLIKITYPDAIIEPQIKIGRKTIDLLVIHNNTKKIIEFLGPIHFIKCKQNYNYELKPFSERKKSIEDESGIECIDWPYWIQRCENNVRAIFESNVQGQCAMWSSKALFGDFYFEDSGPQILELTDRFKAAEGRTMGYMYEKTDGKPEHPIIKEIHAGKSEMILLPKGNQQDTEFWMPENAFDMKKLMANAKKRWPEILKEYKNRNMKL